jgi:hypothetical protein
VRLSPQPVTSPLLWGRRDAESEARARRLSAAKISEVLDSHAGASGVELYLAVGEACPFSRRWECDIWLEELNRILRARTERKPHGE